MYNLIKKIAKIFITKKREDNVILYELFGSIPLRKVVFDNLYVKKYFLGFKYRTVVDIIKLQKSNQIILDKINETNRNFIIKVSEINQNLFNHLYSNEFRTRLVQIACHANAVTATHQKTFGKYKNYHQDQDIVLVATGQSLNKYIAIEKAIHVGVNNAFMYKNRLLDYLFYQDYYAKVNYQKVLEVKVKKEKFIGILDVNWIPQSIIPEQLALEEISRYYVSQPFSPISFTYDISNEILKDAYSVTFSAMQFILYTNPKRIYLVGCDCSNSGHFDNIDDKVSCEHLIDGWQKLKEFAHIYYPETEIISINPVGLKGMFKDVYIEEGNSL